MSAPVQERTETASSRPRSRPGLQGALRLASYAGTPVVLTILLLGVYGTWLGSDFLSTDRRLFDVYQNAPLLIVALGVLIVLLGGHFDLSAASLATLVTVSVYHLRVDQGWSFNLVLVVCVAIGLAAGLFNGLLVAGLKVNAFIATLGTGSVFAGIANVFTDGRTLSGLQGPNALPTWFTGTAESYGSFLNKAPDLVVVGVVALVLLAALSTLRESTADWSPRTRIAAAVVLVGVAALVATQLVNRVNWTILVLVLVTLVFWVGIRFTRTGRNLLAIGDNPAAARLSNIRVERHTVLAYVIAGGAAAVAGILLASQQGSASAGIADPYLLPAYAAVFLSTVIFSHGRFHAWGTVAAGLAVIFVSQGLVTGGLDFKWSTFVNGVVLLVAVSVSTAFRRRVR